MLPVSFISFFASLFMELYFTLFTIFIVCYQCSYLQVSETPYVMPEWVFRVYEKKNVSDEANEV